jgi:hypothetical protein
MVFGLSIRVVLGYCLLLVFASSSTLTALHHWDGHEHERMADCHAALSGDLHWHDLDHELPACGLHDLNTPPYQTGLSPWTISLLTPVPSQSFFAYRAPLSQKGNIRLTGRAPPFPHA